MDGDADDFRGSVVDEGAVDWGEGEGVVDEEGHSTPSTLSASTVKKRVARNFDVGVWTKLGFLNGGDGDFALVEELPKFVDFS